MKRFRFSLRTWFILLTIGTCVFVFGRHVHHRQSLQRLIIEEATLIYKGDRRHTKTELVTSSIWVGTHQMSPRPYVTLRDWSSAPWVSQFSEGDAAFSAFDSVQHHNWVPVWMRDILATGELRKLELRQLRESDMERLDLELLGKRNHQLEKLVLTADRTGQIDLGSSLKGLECLVQLSDLQIYGADGDYIESLPDGLPPNLKHVRMVACKLTTKDAKIFSTCTRLETLDLNANPAGLSPLVKRGLPSTLKILDLANTRVTKDDLRALRNCDQLEELNLNGCDIDLRDGDGVMLPKSLVKLQLDKAILDASSFRMLASLPKLEVLELNESLLKDEHVADIVLAASLKTVGARGTGAGVRFAKALSSADKLESLNFYGTDANNEVLLALGKKPELKTLMLNGKGITNASALWFKPLTKLQRLQLIDTVITDEFFAIAPQLKDVGDLRLGDSPVSDALKKEILAAKQKRFAEQQAQREKMMRQTFSIQP